MEDSGKGNVCNITDRTAGTAIDKTSKNKDTLDAIGSGQILKSDPALNNGVALWSGLFNRRPRHGLLNGTAINIQQIFPHLGNDLLGIRAATCCTGGLEDLIDDSRDRHRHVLRARQG